MRQVWITRAGGPDVLEERDAPLVAPRAGEVRVQVEASGVNFADLVGRMGMYPDAPSIPYVPGYEVAGRVDAVGQGVTTFKEGDNVFGLTRFGGYSDIVNVSANFLFQRLDWMSPEHAAALPVNYLTAYAALVILGAVRPGSRVLIHAAAGGVGLAAVAVCRILGAESWGTASPAKHDLLQQQGLGTAVDYRRFDYERQIEEMTDGRGFDVILDPLGGEHWAKNYRLLAPTGRLICYGASSLVTGPRRSLLAILRLFRAQPRYSPLRLMGDNKGVIGFNLARLWSEKTRVRSWMEQLVAWYDEALFRPHVDRSFPLADAGAAHQYLQQRKNVGKVLLIP